MRREAEEKAAFDFLKTAPISRFDYLKNVLILAKKRNRVGETRFRAGFFGGTCCVERLLSR
jgi:hypothetical protein